MRLRTLIVGLVVLLAIGLVVPLVLMNAGGGHAPNGSGNTVGGSAQLISREWTSLQRSGRPHWPFGHQVGFPPRRVIGIPTRSGYRAELWVAPTRNANFCTLVTFKDRGGGGCLVRAVGAVSAGAFAPGSISRECVLHGPYLVQAAVTDTLAEAVDLVYVDGTSERLQLVRVGRPISASFFLYKLPRDRLTSKTKPNDLRVLDRRGARLSQTRFPFTLSAGTGCRSLS